MRKFSSLESLVSRYLQKFGNIIVKFGYVNSEKALLGYKYHHFEISVPLEHWYLCSLQIFRKFDNVQNIMFQYSDIQIAENQG